MRHVDALSRAPFTSVVTRELNERLRKAQEPDENLKAIMEYSNNESIEIMLLKAEY